MPCRTASWHVAAVDAVLRGPPAVCLALQALFQSPSHHAIAPRSRRLGLRCLLARRRHQSGPLQGLGRRAILVTIATAYPYSFSDASLLRMSLSRRLRGSEARAACPLADDTGCHGQPGQLALVLSFELRPLARVCV